MLRELSKARHFIFLEYFIITPGYMWDQIHAILLEKVKEGVDIRLVYDDFGNLGNTPVNFPEKLRKEGIKTNVFSPIKPFLNVKMNNPVATSLSTSDGTGYYQNWHSTRTSMLATSSRAVTNSSRK